MKEIRIKTEFDYPLFTEAVKELLPEIGLAFSEQAETVVLFRLGDAVSVTAGKRGPVLCGRKRNELFRALSYLPALLENGNEIHETGEAEMLCYMADNSRNAVLNLPSAKRLVRLLALMGYDSLMLYTEDTYEIPQYPYFGYRRGRFSEAELEELDDYADRFGIELIPCIQTLAHLATAIRWPDFNGMRDTEKILLVGEEKTYQFIENAVRQCKKCFRSKKIHIGMDEAHMIGKGEYMERNGYRETSEIMLEHLNRVVSICREAGYAEPMMWSDMFFRMAFHGEYYIREGLIPTAVQQKIPAGVQLVYWDYYNADRALIDHMMECHLSCPGTKTVFAGGAWKWGGFASHNDRSVFVEREHLASCRKFGINRIIVTSWGDDGGEASQFSILGSLLFFAETVYSGNTLTAPSLDFRSGMLFHLSFRELCAFDLPDQFPGISCEDEPKLISKYLLYNDPLEGLTDAHVPPNAAAAYAEAFRELSGLSSHPTLGYAYDTLAALCAVLLRKCDLGIRIRKFYSEKNAAELKKIAEEEIPMILSDLDRFLQKLREQWYRENKSYGFTTQEIRLGGLAERLRSAAWRIEAYLNGKVPQIEELEAPVLPFNGKAEDKYLSSARWSHITSAGVL